MTIADWHGTAQLDERRTGKQLHELVGLDYDDWMILGLDIGGGESHHDLHVPAVDRTIVPDGSDVLPKIAGAHNGEIPVTDFLIHDVDPYELLKAITHVLDLRLRVARTVGIPIRITSLADIPEQD